MAPGVIAADGELRVRAMLDEPQDYELVVRWRNEPHVREWWDPDDPPMTVERAVSECRPAIIGAEPDQLCIIELDGTAVGFVQFSAWFNWQKDLDEMGLTVPPGSWSLDIYIGELERMNRGLGSRVVRLVCDHLFRIQHASAVAFGVEVDNARAKRAYLKAGMRSTVRFRDLDTRGGERVWCDLMVRDAPAM